MSLEFGEKRIGLAVVNKESKIVSPLKTIINNGGKVIACDISNFEEIENGAKPYEFSKKYKDLVYYKCDITNESSVKKMFNNLSKLNFL